MGEFVSITRKLKPSAWPLVLRLLHKLADSVSRLSDADLRTATIELLQSRSDETSEHGAALRDASRAEWILVRYQLAGLLLAANRPEEALMVTEDVIDHFLSEDDINAGNFYNSYGSLLWLERADKKAAIAAWKQARSLKVKAGQNTESVDQNLRMGQSEDPPDRRGVVGPQVAMSDPSQIAADVENAKTQGALLTIHNSWTGERRSDVHAALADAFLERLSKRPDGLDDLLIRLGERAASILTDLGDAAGAEARLARCLDLLPARPSDQTLLQRVLNNRGYARLVQNDREGAREDTDRALALIMAPITRPRKG